jgi:membrane-bound ClpP family serine protease
MMDLDWTNAGRFSHWALILLGILLLATWIFSAQAVLLLLGLALFTLGTAIGSKREAERRFRE